MGQLRDHMRTKTMLLAAGLVSVAPGCDPDQQDEDAITSIGSITATGGADDGADGTAGTAGGGDAGSGGNADTAGVDADDDGGVATGVDLKWDVGWGGSGDGGPGNGCESLPSEDADGDGYTGLQGDCNDCDANVNPGAIEVVITEPDEMGVVPDPADEDCDGGVDNVALPCDGAWAINDTDPTHAAGAMGLCKQAADATDWGIVSAQYVRANGGAGAPGLQSGLLFDFGPNVQPREGSQSLVLSTGNARIPGQPNACGNLTCNGSGAGTAPAGFPQDVPMCPGLSNINDDVALELTLRAPTNATGYSYNFTFYSFEYPEWVCTSYNDQYIALVNPPPPGAINGNISFDAGSNPVSVNIAFFDVCAGCALGTGELAGTGFDVWNDAGATSWLETTAPVTGGEEFTIRFAIWDTGDSAYDSTVVIDNFQWIADGGSVSVGTQPEG